MNIAIATGWSDSPLSRAEHARRAIYGDESQALLGAAFELTAERKAS